MVLLHLFAIFDCGLLFSRSGLISFDVEEGKWRRSVRALAEAENVCEESVLTERERERERDSSRPKHKPHTAKHSATNNSRHGCIKNLKG